MQDFYCNAYHYPKTEDDVFLDSYIDYVTLHVPKDAISQYSNVEPWKNFKTIVAITDEDTGISQTICDDIYIRSNGNILIISGLDDGALVNVYDTTGRLVETAAATGNHALLDVRPRTGKIIIIKIGNKSMKYVMQ